MADLHTLRRAGWFRQTGPRVLRAERNMLRYFCGEPGLLCLRDAPLAARHVAQKITLDGEAL